MNKLSEMDLRIGFGELSEYSENDSFPSLSQKTIEVATTAICTIQSQNEIAERYKQIFINLQEETDIEDGHRFADARVVEMLIALGLADVAEEYSKIKKWYA